MKEISRQYIVAALFSLVCGLCLGCVVGLQFLYPELFPSYLAFHQLRPLHVAFGVWWIFLAAAGGVYYFLGALANDEHVTIDIEWLESKVAKQLASAQLFAWIVTGIGIAFCYLNGIFGGKEYLNYPPTLSLPILFGWILFAVNVIKTVGVMRRSWPVFMWLWLTSTVFFVYSFAEAHFWMLPWFGGNIIRDLTVQWKSYGALVASWNMLIYGLAMCVMYLSSGNRNIVYGRMPFALYFLALVNSLFNWGHHTYTLPTASWIREVSYVVSMAELFILGRIIYFWGKSWRESSEKAYLRSYRFMMAADVWILLNLALALALSVPALNVFLHGTHAVIAHSMGATVGINSMILLSTIYFIMQDQAPKACAARGGAFHFGFYGFNAAFAVFWFALLVAGVKKALLVAQDPFQSYRIILMEIRPFVFTFVGAGIVMFCSFLFLLLPLLKRCCKCWENPTECAEPELGQAA